eukprot:Tamp_39523.p1 GENE.Tamp_39523~~Tamp_39523.p1  ORF type:complete len:106 (-),score=3.89 Tamp_39523:90-407(-)
MRARAAILLALSGAAAAALQMPPAGLRERPCLEQQAPSPACADALPAHDGRPLRPARRTVSPYPVIPGRGLHWEFKLSVNDAPGGGAEPQHPALSTRMPDQRPAS